MHLWLFSLDIDGRRDEQISSSDANTDAAIKTVSTRLHKFGGKIPINSKIAPVNKTRAPRGVRERAIK